MATIDYTIPGQFKGIQIEPPMNAMARAMELRGLQEASNLNALRMQEQEMKMAETQRLNQQRNELAKIHADPNVKVNSPEYLSLVQQRVPDLYEQVASRVLQRADLEEKIQGRKFQNVERKFKMFQSIVPTILTIDGVSQYVAAGYQDPDIGPLLNEIRPYEVAITANQDLFNQDPLAWREQAMAANPKELFDAVKSRREADKPVVVAQGGQLVSPTGDVLFSAEAKAPTPTEAQRNYQAAKDSGFTGTFAEYLDQQRETEAEREYRRAKLPVSQGGSGFTGTFLDFKKLIAKANKFVVQTSSAPTLSKDAIDDQANRFLTDGTLPSLGMGKDAVANRNAIINRASQLARDQGMSNDRVTQLANKANTSALTQLTKQETMVGAFEKNFVKNVDIVDRLSKKTDNTGVPLLQKWINVGKKASSGDPNLAALAVAIKAVQNEYGKIVSGSMGNTAVAVSEIKRMEELLNAAQTPQDVQAVLNTMRQETQNRMLGFKEQKAELTGAMRGSVNKPATPANRPPLNEIFGGKK
jgi:hypothetical protein